MNLKEIRLQFRKETGRHDLVTSAGANNGADFYIYSGQRMLDRMVGLDKEIGRVFRIPSSGINYVTFQDGRAVQEVWAANVDGKSQLERKSIEDLWLGYPKRIDQLTTGKPLYWAPALLRTIPDEPTFLELEAFIGYADVMVGQHYLYNGVVFMPPTDGTYMIEVVGKFYSPKMTTDADVNFWSENHPEILVMAAAWATEAFSRNTQGMNDWMGAINGLLLGLERDTVDSEIAGLTRMEG